MWFKPERALARLLRHDPFTTSSAFPRSSIGGFSRLFDLHSPFSAPLYTVFEVDPSETQKRDVKESKSETSGSASTNNSPSDQSSERRVTGRDRNHGRRRYRPDHPLSVLSSSFSPFTAFPSLMNAFNLNGFPSLAGFNPVVPSMPEMSVDLTSTPTTYTIQAAVPGLTKQDINITVEDNILTIEAERRTESRRERTTPAAQQGKEKAAIDSSNDQAQQSTPSQSSDTSHPVEIQASEVRPVSNEATMDITREEDQTVDYHHVESFYGRVSRSITLPEDARIDDMSAKCENGMLIIDIPRQQEQRQRTRKVQIQ